MIKECYCSLNFLVIHRFIEDNPSVFSLKIDYDLHLRILVMKLNGSVGKM